MKLNCTDVGDDGFAVYVMDPEQTDNVRDVVTQACDAHGVSILDLREDHPRWQEKGSKSFKLRVVFENSQDEDTVDAITTELGQGKYTPGTRAVDGPTTYMVTVTYRGRMHVDPLRVFTDETAARKYASDPSLRGLGQPVMYATTPGNPPKRMEV